MSENGEVTSLRLELQQRKAQLDDLMDLLYDGDTSAIDWRKKLAGAQTAFRESQVQLRKTAKELEQMRVEWMALKHTREQLTRDHQDTLDGVQDDLTDVTANLVTTRSQLETTQKRLAEHYWTDEEKLELLDNRIFDIRAEFQAILDNNVTTQRSRSSGWRDGWADLRSISDLLQQVRHQLTGNWV